MGTCAGIVLAGGRSSRMGSPKAALEWHGSTLLRRVTGIVARGVGGGPVIVVRAPRQALPDPGPAVEVVQDAHDGRGPLQALAAGLGAVGDRAEMAYLSATDVPLLHPAFVRRIIGALDAAGDVALPVIAGRPQPLAAVYRTSLLPLVQELLDADRLRPAFLYERCRVRRVTEAMLGGDPDLRLLDPGLRSLENLNEASDYERVHALPEPPIEVQRCGSLAAPLGAGSERINASTLGRVAAAMGLTLDERVMVTLNGDRVDGDADLPLVAGDRLAFRAADAWR